MIFISMKIILLKFIDEMALYQTNNYGSYPKINLVRAYNNIPEKIKKYLTPPIKKLKNLWRGADDITEKNAISFTDNYDYAKFFGHYVIPFHELHSYSGIIDSGKALKLAEKLKVSEDIPIGDDEGEVIVLNPIWKRTLDLKKYFVG